MDAITTAFASVATARTRLMDVVRGDATVRGRDILSDAYIVFAILWMVLTAVGYFQARDARSWYGHKLPYPYDVTDYKSVMGSGSRLRSRSRSTR